MSLQSDSFQKTPITVGAIVLHFNNVALTQTCCRSLLKQSHPISHLIIVDNGSHEPFPEGLEDVGIPTHILRLPENKGFSGGVNAGIRHLLDAHHPDYIWLINNDIECETNTLRSMIDTVEGAPRIAAAGCILEEENPDGSISQLVGARYPYPILVPFASHTGHPIDYLCGACLLIRMSALNDVGLLNEEYFFFFEDADWCIRAKRNGWLLGVCEKTTVKHQRSATIGRNPRLRASYYRRSYILFLKKYSKAPKTVATFTTLARLILDGVRIDKARCQGTLEGWRQGWRYTDTTPS